MTDTRTPRYGTVDREYAMRLATTPPEDDGPVWMVNLMKYRDVADYSDGRESTISGREADDLYTPLESLAVSARRSSSPVRSTSNCSATCRSGIASGS